ncbi:MAG TPA: aldo/keto reductase [Candidatus Hydrogenedentes bacterium]|nr:aldo/keto reductase [Candidatus Hydrogenedentota bacterium]HPG66968.1 aldo/keto reductase [Candidatus Hydrogenedentota bacterium]
MNYRRLGSSDLDVSAMAFGAWQLGDPAYWGPDAEADGQAAIDAALDAGITLFDTAESYGAGESERALGRALGANRDRVLIASKVSPDHCAPAGLRAACEASLSRLGTDRIDLYQVHWPCRNVPFEDTYAEMTRLRDEGKIRAIGVSNFGPVDLDTWTACGDCASNQLGYNLMFRAIEHAIVPACIERGIGILVYMPLLQGILTGRWTTVDAVPESRRRTRHFASTRSGVRHGEPGCEDLVAGALAQLRAVADELGQPMANAALAWTLARSGVASVIVGARNPGQLQRNIAALDLALDDATVRRLDAITDPIKERLGPNPDMWCGGDKTRIR